MEALNYWCGSLKWISKILVWQILADNNKYLKYWYGSCHNTLPPGSNGPVVLWLYLWILRALDENLPDLRCSLRSSDDVRVAPTTNTAAATTSSRGNFSASVFMIWVCKNVCGYRKLLIILLSFTKSVCSLENIDFLIVCCHIHQSSSFMAATYLH